MKKRSLWICISIFAVLCVAYFGIVGFMSRAEEKEAREEEAQLIYVTDLDEVLSFSVNNGGDILEFAREGDVWYYNQDKSFPVKQSLVEAMIEEASKLQATRKLEQGDELSYYGLDAPEISVTLTDKTGAVTTVKIGNSVEGGGYYAMKEGENIAYTISAGFPDSLKKGLYDYIQVEEFPGIEGVDVKQITITKGEETYHYEKKVIDDQDNIAWYQGSSAVEENRMEDNGRGNTLADAISDLYVQECVNYNTSVGEMAEYGLDQPNATIWYSYELNGETKNLKLEVGSLDKEETYYYTRREGSLAVNKIGKSVIDKCLNVEQ